VQHREQRRVDDQRLGLASQFGHHVPPQGLQEEAPELAEAAVQRGGREADHPGEEVGEEAGGVAQEGAFALHAPKLLNYSRRHNR